MTRIKQLRHEQGKTQENMAAVIGITRGAYANIENGKREPDIKTMTLLANYFGVSLDYLLGRTAQKEPPAPQNEDGQLHEELDREFMRWFQKQSPARQKEVLFDLAKAVTGHDE